jgi:hypothetical protein
LESSTLRKDAKQEHQEKFSNPTKATDDMEELEMKNKVEINK